MKLLSVASAFPEYSYTQNDCLKAMSEAPFWDEINARSRFLLEKVLTGNSGIEKRHFCIDSLELAWSRNAQELNEAYEKAAPKLAVDAVRSAIKRAGLEIKEVDALFLCSCTGFLCPGVSSYVAEQLGMRSDVFHQDMTGLGCGAAVPLMRAAQGVVTLDPDAVIVTVAVEVCSAAFFIEDDFGVLISTCLFGDGASAAVWTGGRGGWQVSNFQSLHIPEEREKIRFTNAGGKLRNQLHKTVPKLAASAVEKLYALRTADPDVLVTHGGGRDVIEALESILPVDSLDYARAVMRDHGNLSSPSVFVALEQCLESSEDNNHIWMCSFGAGFSAHSCELNLFKDQ